MNAEPDNDGNPEALLTRRGTGTGVAAEESDQRNKGRREKISRVGRYMGEVGW